MKYTPLDIELNDSVPLEDLSIGNFSKKVRKIRAESFKRDRDARHYHTHRSNLASLTGGEYVNLSCRFLIRPGSMDVRAIDVNTPLPHNHILRVFSAPSECPICLEQAIAPRMLTGCGHVLCLVCYFNHLKFAERPLCPVCGDFMTKNAKELLPVSFMMADPRFKPQVGHEAVFQLMRRNHGSAVALPASHFLQSNVIAFPGPDQLLYSRIVEDKCSSLFCREELERELKQLEEERATSLAQEYGDEGYSEALGNVRSALHYLPEKFSGAGKSLRAEENDYLFYQTGFEFGDVITILNTLDISILKAAFGDYSKFPTTLVATVEDIIYCELSGDVRNRLKYLGHVPEQTPLALVECNWEGVVPDDVLKRFKHQIADRRKKRKRKLTKEEKDRQRADKILDEKFRQDLVDSIPSAEARPVNIEAANLPSLPRREPDSSSESIDTTPKEKQKAKELQWVDHQAEYDNLMRNAYVPKRGRKHVIISSSD